MHTKEQIESLNKELDSKRVKNRSKGNINLSYLEGFDIFETANSIFGFGNWSYTITKLEQVSQEYNQNENVVLCYKAIVNLKIYNQTHTTFIEKEDVGFGTGISKTLADANESASKEAVTDAIKRAFRSFGNQFGNSLYDKSRNLNQSDTSSTYQQESNHNQNQQRNNQYSHPNIKQNQSTSFNQYEYQSLYNLGLNIVEQNGFLIVTGDDIYSKKDSIKACGFRFDSKSKSWYKQLEQRAS
ncbi:Rad52/Rad22 family DNA repair protein [Aliarcobacter butzleri]|uniref:Rad52/Rad22 family DNA repair protein n=1 Tax=Aliarcobacter butzleri TaxID=28197 RepID=UPI00125EB0A3|nr:Rad52/Rad22 family DNA repair protein [Aliarcobacter butzleri]